MYFRNFAVFQCYPFSKKKNIGSYQGSDFIKGKKGRAKRSKYYKLGHAVLGTSAYTLHVEWMNFGILSILKASIWGKK